MTPHSDGIGAQECLEAIPQPHVLLEAVRDETGTIVDFVFVAANAAACRFNGLPRSELVGCSLLALHPSVAGTGLFAQYVAVVEQQHEFELLDWSYPQDLLGGEVRYYDVHAAPVGGRVAQTWTDVTDRHRAMSRLAESEQRFRTLAENASDVVFMSANDGRLLWISPNTHELTGYQPEDLLGREIGEFLHEEDLPTLREVREQLTAGRASKMPMRFRTASGRYHWVAVTVKPVLDAAGQPVGRAGSWTDIDELMQSQVQAQEHQSRLRATLDAQIDPFIVITPVRGADGHLLDFRYVEANQAALDYNGMTREALIGSLMSQSFPGMARFGPLVEYMEDPARTDPLILDDFRYANELRGEDLRYDIRAVKFGDSMALTWRDVTDRSRAVEALADSEWRYRLLAENASDVIWDLCPDGTIDWASESTPSVLGWSLDQIVGTNAMELVHPDDLLGVESARQRLTETGSTHGKLRLRLEDGSYRWFAATGRADDTDGSWRIIALRDIHDEVSARAELLGRIGRDPLTGLVTRERLQRRLALELEEGRWAGVAVLCVGLDSLSRVNDAYTHAAGDVVLITMAERLLEAAGDDAMVARATGAEFLVMIPEVAPFGDANALAERILTAAREPIDVGEHTISMTVSIGISDAQAGDGPAELVRAAALAMRAAKDAGRNRIAFSTQRLAESAQRWLLLTEQVARGLQQGEFTAWFQPIHQLFDGQLCGYEVLARWLRPDGEVIGPVEFMPVAESTELITGIDIAMMQQALVTAAGLEHPGFVSLNVSARSLHAPAYEAALLEALRGTGLDPGRIHLEVTETNLLDVSDAVVDRMRRIADLGIGWYIDDFGTGYSSISHLRDLPVSGIKLDVSFAAGIEAGETRTMNLALALVGLAQGLGLDTIAEGVETERQVIILAAQGWQFGQGWLFGRPAPLG